MKRNQGHPRRRPPGGSAGELRRRAEERLQTRERIPQSAPDAQRILHELRVHQIELEMQNEELRRAQHELEVSREKYFDLFDLAPMGYLALNEPGLILEANLTAARLLGVARKNLVRQRLTRFVLREDLDIFNQNRQQLFETRAPKQYELRLRRPGGTPIWVRCEAVLAQDNATGAPVCRITLSDLTERKQAEADRERLAQFERLAQLMKCANDIILLTDEDGRILEANDRALETYGYSLAELRQKTLGDLRTPVSRAELPRQMEQLETDGRAVFEAMNQRRDGAAFPVEISARFIEIAGVRHRLAIVRDITERKRAEEALHASEERYRAVVEDQTEVICRFRADGTLTFVNDVYCRFFGKSLQELIGRKWQPVALPADWPQIEEKLRALTPSNPVVVVENRVYSASGQVHWMQFVNRGFFDGGGRLIETQAVGRDITERRRAEEKLHESEAAVRARADELTTMLAATPAITFIAEDRDCRRMTSSRAALRLLRLPAGANTSKSAPRGERPETFRAMKDGRELRPNELPVQLAAATGQAIKNFEMTLAFEDGTARDIVGDAVPLFDAEGQVRGAVGAFLDVTERNLAEERMRTFSQEIIAAREQERKQVSSVLHHDVGSLAVGIAAHLDALEEDLRSGKRREALQWMKRTRKLFSESVIRLKKLAIQLRPPELDVLGLCAALRQHFAQVTERGRTRVHFCENLGRRRLSADTATILFRVAQEALTNAITHGHATRVDVDVKASKEEVQLTVRNNGKAFDPFGKTAQATSHMGLRVMREMALSAGGVFAVDSGRGKGTTVRVRLPL